MFVPGNFLTHALLTKVERSRWSGYLSPPRFLPLVRRLAPWLASGATICCALGFGLGLFVAPLGALQGEVHRILYIHVPASWMAALLYLLIAFWAAVGLFLNARLAPMMAEALAPTGALFAFLALWTGSLWGKPLWGAWLVWDMRLIADLVLLCLYLAIVAIHAGIEDARRADRIVALLALAGAAIVAASLASVVFWPAVLEDPSTRLPESPGGAAAMLAGLLAVAAGFWLYSSAIALWRLRCVILERERQSDWVTQCARDAR